mgnify:FL=1
MLPCSSFSWRPRCPSPAFSADAERRSTSTGMVSIAASQRLIHGRKLSLQRRERGLPLLCPRNLDRRSSSSSPSLAPAPPQSLGSFDPSEGLADAAEDLLRALRAEPESGSGSGIRSGGGGGTPSDTSVGTEDEESRLKRGSSRGGRAARRADELASDGMWPLYQALGDFSDLLDLAGRGVGGGGESDDSEHGAGAPGGVSADAEALSLLRSHPSLLLLPRSELARRLVLLKTAAGPGADAAALARRLPWLLGHGDPGEVVRRAMRQMLALMPGAGGPRELGARLFGGGGGGTGGRRRSPDGRASQSWLTFADIARGESRKLRVEERAARDGGGS